MWSVGIPFGRDSLLFSWRKGVPGCTCWPADTILTLLERSKGHGGLKRHERRFTREHSSWYTGYLRYEGHSRRYCAQIYSAHTCKMWLRGFDNDVSHSKSPLDARVQLEQIHHRSHISCMDSSSLRRAHDYESHRPWKKKWSLHVRQNDEGHVKTRHLRYNAKANTSQKRVANEHNRPKINSNRITAIVVPRRPITLYAIFPGEPCPCLVQRVCSDRLARQLLRPRLHTCHTERRYFSGARTSRRGVDTTLVYTTAQLCTNLLPRNFQVVLGADRVWVASSKLLHTD